MKKIIVCGLVLLLLAGCSSISQSQAEQAADAFIAQNVKFFAKDQGAATDLPEYRVTSRTSYKEGSTWVVIVHVSSTLDGEEKKNDLIVKVDGKGRVTEFNGQEVPR